MKSGKRGRPWFSRGSDSFAEHYCVYAADRGAFEDLNMGLDFTFR
jgi:hypothetical protein